MLRRERLAHRLQESLEYRLTIVQAGTGYGKSTTLATLAEGEIPLGWYHLDSEDVDPLIFLQQLIHSLHRALPTLSTKPLSLLERWEQSKHTTLWRTAVDLLINEIVALAPAPLYLVLDNIHCLQEADEPLRILNRLIGRAPANLHVILATRYPLSLPGLVTWRARGQVLEIGQNELAFTLPEIATLFRTHYGLSLTTAEVARLTAETEGWVIALQLIWQGLRSGAVTTPPGDLRWSSAPSSPKEGLFAYLSQEILEQQSPDIRHFLLTTSILREMTPTSCDCLRGTTDSALILKHLLKSGLFVVEQGENHLRYHNLFREFLYQSLTPEKRQCLHRQAAECYLHIHQQEEALHHLLDAHAAEKAATVLAELGHSLVSAGRLDRLASWIGALPPAILEQHPPLLAYLGDIARLHSRFDEALGWYQQAEEHCRQTGDLSGLGQALRGQARVYLDTVNPTLAENLLQEALRISDGQADRETRIRLLELLAENRLNSGQPQESQELRAQAQALRTEAPSEAELAVRVLLRTGQLAPARQILEKRALIEAQEPILRPRAHRETLLLLSLILSLQGEGEAAYRRATEGIQRGQALNSPFITAVGYMRQGHAWLLRDAPQQYSEACRCYRQAVHISETLAVPRLRVEALWGLCRAHGFRGALEAAADAAAQGLALAQQAGDQWIGALIMLSLGASYALAARYVAAEEWLTQAWAAFHGCGDNLGTGLTELWRCWIWQQTGDETRLEQSLGSLLRRLRAYNYNYLFQRQTLLGPPEPRSLVPLLLFAQQTTSDPHALSLLQQLNLAGLTYHPGYQLRIQMLGSFQLWRGTEKITPHEWRREKARQLCLLLLTERGRLLERESIQEQLSPGLEPEAALRDFKVALSRLYKVLEPHRQRGAPSAYIVRDGTRYGVRPGADIWLDADEFEQLIEQGDQLFAQEPSAASEYYRQALTFYQGEYLQEYPYADWCSVERERLLTLYLRTADRLARTLSDQAAWEESLVICQTILERDNCWEQAYRLMMRAYVALGNHAQAQRTYQHCRTNLRQTLEIAPSPLTEQLHAELLGP